MTSRFYLYKIKRVIISFLLKQFFGARLHVLHNLTPCYRMVVFDGGEAGRDIPIGVLEESFSPGHEHPGPDPSKNWDQSTACASWLVPIGVPPRLRGVSCEQTMTSHCLRQLPSTMTSLSPSSDR